MTYIKAHLMEIDCNWLFSGTSSCFSWLNNGTLWPLRYLETFFTQITKQWRHLSDKTYELLYNVKAYVPTHREGRKELGINGSSDRVDLRTSREDSQIDFVTGNVFCTFGGGGGGGGRTFLKF